MAYQRKTKDIYVVQGYFSAQYGWENVTAEETWKECKIRLKEYRENDPKHVYRFKRTREKILEGVK